MSPFTLFEVSWEVAHRVGGIHTVVATKARSLAGRMGDDYVVVGPWLLDQHDAEAVLDPVVGYGEFVEDCRAMGLPVRVGRWRVPGSPLTILVEFSGLYEKKNEVLSELWSHYSVDSLAGDWGYVEPLLFGHAAGMVIERYWRDVVRGERDAAVVQAHEWMTGSALLYLKSRVPEIGTVFTAHATVIGRAAASEGRIGDDVLQGRTPKETSTALGVRAKHSLEATAACEADVFTTVSEVAAAEAERFLGRAADPVLPNGLDPEVLEDRLGGVSRDRARVSLTDLASRFLGEDVSDAFLLCSGSRYEFRNKGLDLLLDAAAALGEKEGRTVVLFLLVPAGNSGLRRSISARLKTKKRADGPPLGIALHNLFEPDADPIAVRCRERGLDNAHGSRVRVIHWADYVSPEDGILGLRYESVLQGADATCFPSFYEAWGYTPQESLALGVPTVTTDVAGFGLWARENGFGTAEGVHVLSRAGRTDDEIVSDLTIILDRLVSNGSDGEALSAACRTVAAATFWPQLIGAYDTAHGTALAAARERARESGDAVAATRFLLPLRSKAQNGRPHVFPLDVPTVVPDAIAGLQELAGNWAWAWDTDAPELFREIAPDIWTEVRHAPLRLLRAVRYERLEECASDAEYVARVTAATTRVRAYLAQPLAEDAVTAENPVAYVCAEFGIHESFPIYSGGLGVLAGDHLRAASDLGVPLVAVGLLYRAGYMRQVLREGVDQEAVPERVDPADLPLDAVVDAAGQPIEVTLNLPGSEAVLRAWRTRVGRITLYLLDANVARNRPEDRELTRALYSGDQEMRIRQEIVLGIGGVRLLRALDISPSVFHINEGHGAFASLERMRHLLQETGLTFDEGREAIRATTVFTTHTPVPAGHDEFSEELVRRYFGDAEHWVGAPWERFMALGASSEAPGRFNMTGLAVRFAARVNGVSVKHAEVSRDLLHRFAPQLLAAETPIHAITNGVHLGFWTRPVVRAAVGEADYGCLATAFEQSESMSDSAAWRIRQSLRQDLHENLIAHLRRTFARQGDSPSLLAAVEKRLDPKALCIGFARRFATYKRAGLIFRDEERLLRLLSDDERPVRLLIAGKAHPRDTKAQELIAHIGRLARDERFVGRVVLIENYDIDVARWLVAGVDVWLNNPRPPLEASGTSGMKASANGALNLSVGDGWWLEGFDGVNGWRIGGDVIPPDPEQQDAEDGQILYGLLEHEVVPEFFDRDEDGVPLRWTPRVRRAMATVPPQFDAARMVSDYRAWAYEPLARAHAGLRGDRFGAAIETFRDILRVRSSLGEVRITAAAVGDVTEVRPGHTLAIGVDVVLGDLAPEDVLVEALLGRRDDDGGLHSVKTLVLQCRGPSDDQGARHYTGELDVRSSGALGYAVRVRPVRDEGPAFDDPVVWA